MNIVQLTPALLGLTQMFKMLGVPNRFLPVVSILLGIGIAMLASGVSVEIGLDGLLAGLAASGLYSGVKNTVK